MKFLHWNVHMWEDNDGRSNTDAVTDLISETAPDVVSLVEVDEQWGHPKHLEKIASAGGYSSIFVPAFEYRCEGGFGNALLARMPIEAVHQWHLVGPRLYDGTEPSEARTAVLTRLAIAGEQLWVGSTHLPRSSGPMRTKASTRLLQLLQNLDRWIVCGDFNQPSSWLPSDITVAPNPPIATYPASDPSEPIDYCIARRVTVNAHVLDSQASDHLPLLCDVQIPLP